MYSSTQPYHWNPNLGRSNVTIEQTVEFVGGYNNVVKITYQVTNNESYTIASGHEAPVAYIINNPFDRRLTYDGSSPWTYGGLKSGPARRAQQNRGSEFFDGTTISLITYQA